jgi:hypothetical protein
VISTFMSHTPKVSGRRMRGFRPSVYPPRGHFTWMPTRSLHARGAGALEDSFSVPGFGGITRFA